MMMINRLKVVGVILVAILLIVGCGGKSNSKKINIAYTNWAEGIAITHVVKAVFEDQGYDVKLLNADVAPIFTSLSRQKTDVFLDVWMPITHADYMTQYGDKLEVLGDVFQNARIGLVVPSYVKISSIEELNQFKKEFGGAIVGIDAGAGIMKTTEKAIDAYQLDYKLMTSSGPAMTASLKKAIDDKEYVVVTGWTPHWMFDRFDLKVLEDSKKVYGDAEKIQTVAWKGFTESDPFAAELLSHVRFSDAEISSLMTAIEESETTEDDAARQWIAQHRELIDSWIPQLQK